MVDGLALVRIDVKSWIRKVTVVGITQKIESVLAFTAVKSSVDVDKISFNTFMEAYKYQLQRDAAHALNENDLMKEIKRAKEVYNLLKTDSAESTLVFDTLKLPGQIFTRFYSLKKFPVVRAGKSFFISSSTYLYIIS